MTPDLSDLRIRFRRRSPEEAHVEAWHSGTPKPGVSLCGEVIFTDEYLKLAPYPLGSEAAALFWHVVCGACGAEMDRRS
jgi:hypothetical protein